MNKYDEARDKLRAANDGKPMSRQDARDLAEAIALPALELAEAAEQSRVCSIEDCMICQDEVFSALAAFNAALSGALKETT